MSGSGSGSTPNLQHSESSLSLRTRKSNQDFRVLAAENLARKGSPLAVDERVFGAPVADDYEERDELLGNGNSEVIEIGNYDDGWQYTSKKDARKRWCKWLHCSRVWDRIDLLDLSLTQPYLPRHFGVVCAWCSLAWAFLDLSLCSLSANSTGRQRRNHISTTTAQPTLIQLSFISHWMDSETITWIEKLHQTLI